MKWIKLWEQYKNLNDNFWKWFSGSKIVDSNDNPLILYHGSKTKFDTFKTSTHIGNQGETDQIPGIYFTDNKTAASFYSLADDERFIKPVYLSIKNPYYADNMLGLKKELDVEKSKDITFILKDLGYDGLIVEKGFYSYGGPFILYLAFYPEQIKSIKNDGSWDINDPNIFS